MMVVVVVAGPAALPAAGRAAIAGIGIAATRIWIAGAVARVTPAGPGSGAAAATRAGAAARAGAAGATTTALFAAGTAAFLTAATVVWWIGVSQLRKIGFAAAFAWS